MGPPFARHVAGSLQAIDDLGGGGGRHLQVRGQLTGRHRPVVEELLQGGHIGDVDAQALADLAADLARQHRDGLQALTDRVAGHVRDAPGAGRQTGIVRRHGRDPYC